jgi:hypothetical protein
MRQEWSAPRSTIEMLFSCGLTVSYRWLTDLLSELSDHCMDNARVVNRGPHLLAYGNVNVSTCRVTQESTTADQSQGYNWDDRNVTQTIKRPR